MKSTLVLLVLVLLVCLVERIHAVQTTQKGFVCGLCMRSSATYETMTCSSDMQSATYWTGCNAGCTVCTTNTTVKKLVATAIKSADGTESLNAILMGVMYCSPVQFNRYQDQCITLNYVDGLVGGLCTPHENFGGDMVKCVDGKAVAYSCTDSNCASCTAIQATSDCRQANGQMLTLRCLNATQYPRCAVLQLSEAVPITLEVCGTCRIKKDPTTGAVLESGMTKCYSDRVEHFTGCTRDDCTNCSIRYVGAYGSTILVLEPQSQGLPTPILATPIAPVNCPTTLSQEQLSGSSCNGTVVGRDSMAAGFCYVDSGKGSIATCQNGNYALSQCLDSSCAKNCTTVTVANGACPTQKPQTRMTCATNQAGCYLVRAQQANSGCAFSAPGIPCASLSSLGCVKQGDLCIDSLCPQLANKLSCEGRFGCQWTNDACLDKQLSSGTSALQCSFITNRTLCIGSCTWKNDACTKSTDCQLITKPTVDTCSSTACAFASNIGVCYWRSCEAKTTEDDCRNLYQCAWDEGSTVCVDKQFVQSSFPCQNLTVKATCAGKCKWSNGACTSSVKPACGKDSSCPSYCVKDTVLGVCYNPLCEQSTPEKCYNNVGCIVVDNKCVDHQFKELTLPCNLITAASKCAGQCQWNATTLQCSVMSKILGTQTSASCSTTAVNQEQAAYLSLCGSLVALESQPAFGASLQDIRNKVSTACTGPCRAFLSTVNCSRTLKLVGQFCSVDDTTKETCGTAIVTGRLFHCGEITTSTSSDVITECNAQSNCMFDTTTQLCVLRQGNRLNQTLLQAACTPCHRSFLDKYARLTQQSSSDLALFDLLCSRDASDNSLCIVQSSLRPSDFLVKDPTSTFTTAVLSGICDTLAHRRCFSRMFMAAIKVREAEADAAYNECKERAAEDPDQMQLCEARLSEAVRQQSAAMGVVNHMCDKNAAGAYCLGLFADLQASSSSFSSCLQSVVISNDICTVSCAATLRTALEGFGCCVGAIQSTFSTSKDKLGFLQAVKNCSNTSTIDRDIAQSCSNATNSFTRRASFKINIPFAAINSSAILALLDEAIRNDIASHTGVPPEKITSIIFNRTEPSSRRVTGDSQTVVSFGIGGSSSSEVSDAVSSLSRGVSAGTFTLSESSAVLAEQCSTCDVATLETTGLTTTSAASHIQSSFFHATVLLAILLFIA